MKKVIMLLFVAYISSNWLNAQQLNPETINSSDLIVEATVLKKEFRYNKKNSSEIETLNHLFVTDCLKGNLSNHKLAVITEGGQLDGFIQTVSHSARFYEGQKGIFFLKIAGENGGNLLTTLNFDETQFIEFVDNNINHEAICSHSHEKFESRRSLKSQIKPERLRKTSSIPSEVCLTIDNIIPNLSNNSVLFDVKIKANEEGYMLSELSLNFSYPAENLGESIVSNENILISEGVVIENEIYDLSISDQDDESVQIDITTDCVLPSVSETEDYYILSTEYEKLFTVELNIEQWGNYGDLSIEDFEFSGSAKHILDEGECIEFDELCTEKDDFQLVPCNITHFTTPTFGAGIQQIMTIHGTGFDNAGMLSIPNADDGGATKLNIISTNARWIKSWNPTAIEVLVSSIAPGDHPMGSGEWIVDPATNMSCMDTVDIEYAISNNYVAPDERMNSIATNPYSISFNPPKGNDSYIWYIDSVGIDTNNMLKAQGVSYNDVLSVCKAAFCDWEMASGLEFKFGGNNPNGRNANDQKYTIAVGNLSGSMLAVTKNNFATGLCTPANDPYIDGRLSDSDILIDEKDMWFASTANTGIKNNQFDLYSVMIHEIGHLLLLDHAMDTLSNGTLDDRVMYWKIDPKQVKRAIDQKSLNGIGVQKTRTQSALSGCLSGYAMNTNTDGCTSSTKNIVEDFNISLPNPISTNTNFVISSDKLIKGLRIFDLNGRLVKQSIGLKETQINVTGIEIAGAYLVQLQIGNHWFTKKLIIL